MGNIARSGQTGVGRRPVLVLNVAWVGSLSYERTASSTPSNSNFGCIKTDNGIGEVVGRFGHFGEVNAEHGDFLG